MYLKQQTSLNYLKAVLVVSLFAGMLIANLHVYECSDHHSSDDQDCTTCIVQKSTAEFLISYPDTAIAAQYPTDKSSLLTMGNVVEDVFALALSSRAPPLYFL